MSSMDFLLSKYSNQLVLFANHFRNPSGLSVCVSVVAGLGQRRRVDLVEPRLPQVHTTPASTFCRDPAGTATASRTKQCARQLPELQPKPARPSHHTLKRTADTSRVNLAIPAAYRAPH